MTITDPRLRSFERLASTVNGRVTDAAIRHAVYLERYKTHVANQVVALLNKDVFPDLLRKAEAALQDINALRWMPRTIRERRIAELSQALWQTLRVGMRRARNGFADELRDLAISEAEWQRRTMKRAVPKPLNLDIITPSPVLLKSIVTSRPFEGRLLRDWFNNLGRSTRRLVVKEIKIGMIEGEGIPAIMRRIRGTRAAKFSDGVLRLPRHHAEAIIRTAVAHTSNAAAMETFKANDDVVKGWQFRATLDARTTEICMSLDGRVYELGGGGADQPPLHINCRSRMAPVLKSWKELGIPLKEIPPGVRASMGGYVPSTLTYPEWLRQQPKEVIYEALGRGKGDLFLRGKLKIEQFIDRRGHPLTLKQLEALEAQQ